MAELRVYRIPYSAHVERIALAAAFKGVPVEWVDVDPGDRRTVRRLSGQDLVPVAEDLTDGRVLVDSPSILRWMETRWPTPSLWAADPGEAALADVFCRRFDDVWKGPPQRLAVQLGPVSFDLGALPERERRAVEDDAARMRTWTERFERRLADGEHLGGDDFGICDVMAHPFLRFGLHPPQVDDADPFHRVLHDYGRIDPVEHPLLTAWVLRVDARPRG